MAAPPYEALDKGESQWLHAVDVQFVCNALNFILFHRMTNKLWGCDGNVEICPVEDGMYVIQLPNTRARDMVLESNSWHI